MTKRPSLKQQLKEFVHQLPFNHRLLVVDDEPAIRSMLTNYLSRQEIPTDEVLTAEDAIKRLPIDKYAVVLADKELPGMDGIELLKTIKKDWSLTEVIVITGYASADSALEAIKEGAFDYISKPILNLPQFVDKVREAIARHNFEANMQSVIQLLLKRHEEHSEDFGESEQAQRIEELLLSSRTQEGPAHVLVVGSTFHAKIVESLGYQATSSEELGQACAAAKRLQAPTAVFVEREDDDIDGAEAVQQLHQVNQDIAVFVLAREENLQRIIRAASSGVGDYIVYPMEGQDLFAARLDRLVARQKHLALYRRLISALHYLDVDIPVSTA